MHQLLTSLYFWIRFVGISLAVFVLELFFLGYFAVPIVDYRIPYMGEITMFDFVFVGVFAVLFGFGATLFLLTRRVHAASCAAGSVSGVAAFFTFLCPVCPVFFLSYFGLSATLLAVAPYFWWFRLGAFVFLLIGIAALWKRFEPRREPSFDWHSVFQKSAVVITAILLISNQALAMNIVRDLTGDGSDTAIVISGDFAQDVAALVTPSSLPFYGPDLGLDFSNLSNINASIRKMAIMAPKQGSNPIELTDAEMERYVAIGTEPTVACEFCCSVKTLVREDGSPTCGCAHSIAMRGTVAYLIRNYPDMTNEEISYELVRQKGLYFPKQMQKRMAQQLAGEVQDLTPDIQYLTMNLNPSELTDLQKKAKDEGFEPDTSSPSMVGGC